MKTLPRSERPAPAPRSNNFGRNSSESFPISTLIKSRFFSAPKLWPANEQHVRRPGWTELFYDLVFAAAISQLSAPLEADYSLHGVRSEEHTSELQSRGHLVCRLLLEKKKKKY